MRRRVPTISVIIPGYNNGQFIAETIQTVRQQTLPPDEIIVVDDGSSDNTEAVVRSILDDRIQYVRQPNSGVSVARNNGLERATGEFVSFLDADDRWRPETLRTQWSLMESEPQLICCFGNFVRFENDTGKVLPEQFSFYPELKQVRIKTAKNESGYVIDDEAFPSVIGFGEFPAYTQTMMFRAQRIRDIRFDPRLIRCQDAHFVLRVMLRGRVGFSDRILAEVRRHGGNATRDVGMMALDQLRAIECVGEDPLVDSYREVYERRVTRARFDAAGALAVRGRRLEGFRYWRSALRAGGLKSQKAKGTLRFLWLLARGVMPG